MKILYFDVEYANSKNMSICQMGLMAKNYETGELIYPELSIYINPKDDFSQICINVHGITGKMVEKEKTFDKAWEDIEKYFSKSVVVGHNVKGADLPALCKNLVRYGLNIPDMWYIDTLDIAHDYVAYYVLKNGYRLSSLCDYFGIEIKNEHNAFDDARAGADLLHALVDNYHIDIEKYVRKYLPDENFEYVPYVSSLSLVREIAILLGIIKGIGADGIVNEKEKQFLIKWLDDHSKFEKVCEVESIIGTLKEVLKDGIVTNEEIACLMDVVSSYTQKVNGACETKATQELQGIVNGMICDKQLPDKEIYYIERWIYDNNFLLGNYPYDKINAKISQILADGIITHEEKEDLLVLFEELFMPLKESNNQVVEISGKTFCLSGDFNFGIKKDVEAFIVNNNGIIHNALKKSTNYVVVGMGGSQAYSYGTYGSKVKKAKEIGVMVITEEQLFSRKD